jgi:hypothetical protein
VVNYLVNETGEERFVGMPEQGGRDLISADPLPPGTIYAASVSGDGTDGLYRVEVSLSAGAGKLRSAGGIAAAMKESVNRAFLANKSAFGVAREVVQSFRCGNGILSVAIHRIKDLSGRRSLVFSWEKWRSLVDVHRRPRDGSFGCCLKPLGKNNRTFSTLLYEWVDGNGYGNLGPLIETAARQAQS